MLFLFSPPAVPTNLPQPPRTVTVSEKETSSILPPPPLSPALASDIVQASSTSLIEDPVEISDIRISEIDENMVHLDSLLADIRANTHLHLREREKESLTFLEKFRITMSELPQCEQARHPLLFSESRKFYDANNVSEVFHLIRPYTLYPNYELLESIIKKFGNLPLKEEMNGYVLQVEAFERSTMINEFLASTTGCYDIPNDYKGVIIEMKKDSSRCSLHDIRVFVKKTLTKQSHFAPYTLFIQQVAVKSVLVHLGVPRQSLAQLSTVFDEQFKDAHCIVSVAFEGGELQVQFYRIQNEKIAFQKMLQ